MRVPEIDCATAAEMLDAGAAWIDVRELDEWTEARIGGTTHVPMRRAALDLTQMYPDRSAPMVISCLSGSRSAMIVMRLRDQGYDDVHNLRGGIAAWAREGRSVEVGA